jgi:dihydrolipoamide dehydrogenase
MKTALVEEDRWGGSVLNYRDVPCSAMFHAGHLYYEAVRGARFGLSSGTLRYNYPTMANFRSVVMRRAGANSRKVFEDAGVDCLRGKAHFLSPYEVSVGERRVSAGKFVIATGAVGADVGIKGLAGVEYWTARNVWEMVRPPKTIFVVGAGATGCEMAQFFAEMGTQVLIADIAGRLLPREDEEVGQVMDEVFNKRLGIKVLTQARVVAIDKDAVSKKVIFMRGGREKSVRIDAVLVCTGSVPAVDIGLMNAGVKYGKDGIETDKSMQTSVKHIWAIGDVIGGDSSTERAMAEAGVVVTNMVHKTKNLIDTRGFVRMTDTRPAVASVGATEDDCMRRDQKMRKVVVPLAVSSASNTEDFRDGFVKLLTDRAGKLIGGTVMAPEAGVMAQELAMAIRYEMSAREVAEVPHVAGDWGEVVRIAARRLAK